MRSFSGTRIPAARESHLPERKSLWLRALLRSDSRVRAPRRRGSSSELYRGTQDRPPIEPPYWECLLGSEDDVDERSELALGSALAVDEVLSGVVLGVEELVGVEPEDLEGALAPDGLVAALDGLLGLVDVLPAGARGHGALEDVADVVGPIELARVSLVSFHDQHLDPGHVVSFLAVLDVDRDTSGGGDRGAHGDLAGGRAGV
mmetsp:Transcript_12809/g.54969  ORF Transcript_12809/g.54969 Transcript_12809/m.54969 type:complete len:204 (+) Transcript_12809:1443-2054(+)